LLSAVISEHFSENRMIISLVAAKIRYPKNVRFFGPPCRWPWITLNGHFALKSVSGSATNGLASPAFGQNYSKTCIVTHILSATKMQPRERSFWQYKVNANIRGGSLGGVKWECGRWKWRFSLLSFTIFRTFYIHGHTTAFTWCDCRWLWRYFKVIRLFHIKFLVNGALYGKSDYRVLIRNHTLAFDWCHFWWPWSTFEGHFSLGYHFHVHFSNRWKAIASRGLPAIAKLLALHARILSFTCETKRTFCPFCRRSGVVYPPRPPCSGYRPVGAFIHALLSSRVALALAKLSC